VVFSTLRFGSPRTKISRNIYFQDYQQRVQPQAASDFSAIFVNGGTGCVQSWSVSLTIEVSRIFHRTVSVTVKSCGRCRQPARPQILLTVIAVAPITFIGSILTSGVDLALVWPFFNAAAVSRAGDIGGRQPMHPKDRPSVFGAKATLPCALRLQLAQTLRNNWVRCPVYPLPF